MSLGRSHSIGYYNLNWFYQLSWWSKLASVKTFLSRCHTWQILFADSNRRIKSPISGLSDIGDFIRLSRWSAKIAIAAPGTPGDFRPIADIGVWNRQMCRRLWTVVSSVKPLVWAKLDVILTFEQTLYHMAAQTPSL